MEWIEVADEIPPFNEPVLVCDEFDTIVTIGRLIEINEKGDIESPRFDVFDLNNIDDNYIVTHWMPLPLPVG